MAKTYLDQLVEYPAQVIKKICEDKQCVALLINKSVSEITEDDFDVVLDRYIFDYQYVDETVQTSAAYIWAEIEIGSVDNRQIKEVNLYVTVACHKSFMPLNGTLYPGLMGNRRDNLVRFVDRVLNDTMFLGIGALKLNTVKTLTTVNGFTVREITYAVPDFNIVEINE